MAFSITSPAFGDAGTVPEQFTCDGDNAPPPIRVSDAPDGTRSFAIVMDDPDAPRGTFTHWLAYDVRTRGSQLDPGSGKTLPNGFGSEGYGGPCPPHGDRPHHYSLSVYALDVPSLALSGATRQDLEKALQIHTLARAEVTATYSRR
jgi:Raf kinase inhibitor-like YbhB/YbcL family protein